MKLYPSDSLFARLIKERDNWTCQRCFVRRQAGGLDCSHYWGRRMKTVRFHPLNCDALCRGCHSLWEENKKGEYRRWKIRQLGEAKHKELERLAYTMKPFGQRGFNSVGKYMKEHGLEGLAEWVEGFTWLSSSKSKKLT